jgi:putative DNA primase/helicase
VIYQSENRPTAEYSIAGSLKAWRDEIAKLACGNPLLNVAISCAFVGPLLRLTNAESGGIHFVGESSTGKTTLLEVARSVWGGESFKRTWRATANGIEGVASLFNDGLLVLDEIGECDSKDVGKVIYFLGNGAGKQRADRLGNARALNRWRCFILSSGELSIPTIIKESGAHARSGQEIRLLDLPAKRKYGVFDNLHGAADGRALADRLKATAARHYGYAGREFLRRLTEEKTDLSQVLAEIREFFVVNSNDGQACRAAARFSLIALAGELATGYGLTGWQSGEAIEAARLCFQAWLNFRGDGRAEDRKILEAVAAFIDRHGDSRFSSIDEESAVRDRAGWWKDKDGMRIWLFTSAGLQEALKGFDLKLAIDVLERNGWLEAGTPGHRGSRPFRIGGRVVRLYPLTVKVDDEHS